MIQTEPVIQAISDTLLSLQGIAVDSTIALQLAADRVAAESGGNGLAHQMMSLILQIAVLIFAAHIGGRLAMKLKFPGVIGELLAGIVVGPYVFGAISIPGLFNHGIFPLVTDSALSVSPELYGFATIASIILLFMTGLETDLEMFLRYSVAGTVVGIGGVIVSMIGGMLVGPLFLDIPLTDPVSLFLGVLCTATSVGITARILSEKRKIDSSEGVTILAGAVIDDVLGIICLAVVMGIVEANRIAGNLEAGMEWGPTAWIALKAVLVWLVFSALGLFFARKISAFLKNYYSVTAMVTAALGLAFILAAVFEMAGLAMIIGAYVMGLALSKTDLKFLLMERLHDFYGFFVPVFFAVMGALVDIRQFMNPEVLIVGAAYGGFACAAKLIGCGLPSLALKFNLLGALRVGVGMVPRGEVALIIAGLGVAGGILSPEQFGIAILMTMLTTIAAPPVLAYLLDIPRRGTVRDDARNDDTIMTEFSFPHPLFLEMMVDKLREAFALEGFFITAMEHDDKIYQMRKDDLAFSMMPHGQKVEFSSPPSQVFYIKTAVYETLLDLNRSIETMKKLSRPEEVGLNFPVSEKGQNAVLPVKNPLTFAIRTDCIRLRLSDTRSKAAVIRELVDILRDAGLITDRDAIFDAVMDREKQISTGLQDGVAIPHAKTNETNGVHIAIGLCPEGMNFESLDGRPTHLIALIISPKEHPSAHLQCLATLSSLAIAPGFMEQLMKAQTFVEVRNLFLSKPSK